MSTKGHWIFSCVLPIVLLNSCVWFKKLFCLNNAPGLPHPIVTPRLILHKDLCHFINCFFSQPCVTSISGGLPFSYRHIEWYSAGSERKLLCWPYLSVCLVVFLPWHVSILSGIFPFTERASSQYGQYTRAETAARQHVHLTWTTCARWMEWWRQPQ